MPLIFSLIFSCFISQKVFAKNFKYSLQISEMDWKSQNNEFELDWGIEIANLNQEKFEFSFNYNNSYDRQTDFFQGVTTRSKTHDFKNEFDINKIIKNLGSTSYLSLHQEKENALYVTRYDIDIAPLGVKWDIVESKVLTELSISYNPAYNYFEAYSQSVDFLTNQTITSKAVTQSLHHVFKIESSLSFYSGKLTIESDFTWKEIKNFNKADDAVANGKAINSLSTINWSPSDWFSLGYSYTVDYDERRKQFQQTSNTVRTSQVRANLSY